MSDQDLDRKLRRALLPSQTTAEQRKRYQALFARQEAEETRLVKHLGLAEIGVITLAAIIIAIGVAWWQQGQPADDNHDSIAIVAVTTTPTFTLESLSTRFATTRQTVTNTPTSAPSPTPTLEVVPIDPPPTCPVTKSEAGGFTPPEPYPATPPEMYAAVWHGTDELWTMVNPEGEIWSGLPYDHGFSQKTFWWRAGYKAVIEPRPAITVTGRRLDRPGPTFEAGGPGTNGMRADIGDFMLVGISIPTPGCWEITGHYDGVELSYVVWVFAKS